MYLFYIDESQTPDPKSSPPKGTFALVAMGMLDHHWRGFNHTMREFKRGLYQRDAQKPADSLTIKDYEVKSNRLRIGKERKKHPFLNALSDKTITTLSDKYFQQLDYNEMILLGVVINKSALSADHAPHDIHNKGMELLYEQIEVLMWKSHPSHKAIIIVDDCDARTNAKIALRHADFLRTQTSSGIHFRNIVETPLFIRSELSEGIQLVDLCAYNVYRAFAHDDMNYSYFKNILPYFHRFPGAQSDITSIIKVFPDIDRRFPRLI